MFTFLKRVVYLVFHLSRVKLSRERRKLHLFDLVTQVEDPLPGDVQMVYSIADDSVHTVPWNSYIKGGKFTATPDNTLVYEHHDAERLLYKIDNRSVVPFSVIQYCSPQELCLFATRINRSYNIDVPLMGLFADKSTGHPMLIMTKNGDVDTGHCIVCDLYNARGAGICHNEPIAHVVKTRSILDNTVTRPIELEDIVKMYSGEWNKSVINLIVSSMFEAIKTSEVKFDTFSVYAKGMTSIKVQGSDSTMESAKSPTPVIPQPPVTPGKPRRTDTTRKVKT